MKFDTVLPQNKSFEELIDTKTAAELLGGMHPKTLQKKAREKQIPGYFLFNRWHFRKSDLDKLVLCTLNSCSESVRVN